MDEIQYDETQLGQIKILIENGGSNQSYLIKAYEINSDVNLIIERNQLSVDNKLSISGLKPSTYWIRIEWEGSCFKTVGGLNGIVVGSKNEQQ